MTNQFLDRGGQIFGRWTILSYARSNSAGRIWLCRCECGTEREVGWPSLQSGVSKSRSCGKEIFVRTHGRSKTKLYGVWKSMISRCEVENDARYKRYGARGISVCKRWRDSFENFLEDMGERPSEKHSIDRIDNNGNYEKENCRWGTANEQGRNKRDTRMLTFKGETKSMIEWSEVLGIGYSALRNRLNVYGWSVERSLSTPAGEAPPPTEGTSKRIFVDHVGEKHDNWTILSYSHFVTNTGRLWLCRCICGFEKTVSYSALKSGKSRSCGCMSKKYTKN